MIRSVIVLITFLPASVLWGKAPNFTSSKDAKDKIKNSPEATSTYNQYCASCHGFSGNGDGPAAAAVVPPPRNFADNNWQAGASDDDIVTIITEGGPSMGLSPHMPGWEGILNKKQIDLLMLKVRSFGELTDKPSAVHSAAEAYQQYCAPCHGSTGNGKGVALKSTKILARDFRDTEWQTKTTDARIRELIRTGGAANGLDNAMPGFGKSLDPYIEGLVKLIRDFSDKPTSSRKN